MQRRRSILIRSAVAILAVLLASALAASLRGEDMAASPLMISEVRPVGDVEWVELHNPSNEPVSLDGWFLEDSDAFSLLPNVEIAGGGVVVVIGHGTEFVAPAGRTLIRLDSARIGNGLRNPGDRVALIDPYGTRHDAVSWGDRYIPFALPTPGESQSIVRSSSGYARLSDAPSPWEADGGRRLARGVDQAVSLDGTVSIVSVVPKPFDDEPELVTIRNHGDQPQLTINWSLSVGNSSVTLPSVRLDPGEQRAFSAEELGLSAGFGDRGGSLILRDWRGHWISTASYGSVSVFHQLTAPDEGEELSFNDRDRIRPRSGPQHGGDQPGWATDPHPSRMTVDSISLRFERLAPARQIMQEGTSDVWISEAYPNAGQGRDDPAYEWFELSNRTDEEISLDGWTIGDNTAADSLAGATLPAGGTLVVAGSELAVDGVVFVVADGRIGNGLANSGDQLRLIDPEGVVVDAMSWGNNDEFGRVSAPQNDESVQRATKGGALRLGRPSAGELESATTASPAESAQDESADETQDEASDQRAPDDATGRAGSVRVIEIISSTPVVHFAELLPAPLTGQAEWVELINLGSSPVDLSGWAIGDAARQTPLDGEIPPYGRFVIANQPIDGADQVVERIGNGLNNDGDTLELLDADGVAVDIVTYGSDDLPAPDRGLSIALEPRRWVISASPSPGSDDVTPLIDEALRTPTTLPPSSPSEPLPVVAAPVEPGTNAWMIVTFALIGVILMLIIRRWPPPEVKASDSEQREMVVYGGPPPEPTEPLDDES